MEQMKNIAVYGAGDYGREIACLIKAVNKKAAQWNIIGFFDDDLSAGHENEYGKVLGGLAELNRYPQPLALVMAIDRPHDLKKTVEQITNPLIDFPNIIAPDVRLSDKSNVSTNRQGNAG
jgi:glycerol-3-phosphate dehydrogenase